MRTNKNCPKYGEDSEIQVETRDLEKASGKSTSLDITPQPQPKPMLKKIIQKSATKIAVVEASEEDKSSSKAKVLKVKCGSTDKFPDKVTPATSQISDRPVTSDNETANKSSIKVNRIVFSNKVKPDDVQVESQKPSIVIKPPTETDRDQPRKKIIIKRPKEVDLDQLSQEGSTGLEYRKTKKIVELSSFQKHNEEAAKRKSREDKRFWEEKEKRRTAERQREESARRFHEEQSRKLEEQERVAEIRRYEEAIRREREEEEQQKARKKKKKNKRPEMRDTYLDDFPPRKNDRRMVERERMGKRRPAALEVGRFSADYAPPPTKRRRGGEVIKAYAWILICHVLFLIWGSSPITSMSSSMFPLAVVLLSYLLRSNNIFKQLYLIFIVLSNAFVRT